MTPGAANRDSRDSRAFVPATDAHWSVGRRIWMGAYRRGRQFFYSIRYHGIAFTLLRLAIFSLRRTKTAWFRRQLDEHFDRRHAVDTGGCLSFADLGVDSAVTEQCNDYEATPPETIAAMLSSLPIAFKDYVFLDLGAGKGLALLIASLYEFKSLIGVEISPRLCDIARENVRVFRNRRQRCRDIHVFCADATAFSFPQRPLVIYMFNVFQRDLIRRVLRNIDTSFAANPRHIVVVYYNPLYADAFEDIDCLRLKWRDGESVAWHIYETQHVEGRPGHPHARQFGRSALPPSAKQ